jgi:uncharacterized protein (TIGR04255 family)
MEHICYKRNFITEAICKIDFLNSIEALNENLPKEFSDAVKIHFPIAELRIVTNNNVVISDNEVKNIQENIKEWNFWNKDRTRRIILTKTSLFLAQTRYTTFADFKDEFSIAFNSLCCIYKDLIINRFGVRFVNNIRVLEEAPLSWNDYIAPQLIASIEIPKDKDKISRSFHTLEMTYETYNLRFNYGIHNPDYPAIIKQKVFILDIDVYQVGIQNKEDVIENLPVFQSKIQEFFETSITEKFRKNQLGYE